MALYQIRWDTTQPAAQVEGEGYTFLFYWRPRLRAWYVDILDADGAYVQRGGRISRSCLLGVASLRFPGTLFSTSPTPEKLGDPVLLYWDKP